jgi:hypothetical protein
VERSTDYKNVRGVPDLLQDALPLEDNFRNRGDIPTLLKQRMPILSTLGHVMIAICPRPRSDAPTMLTLLTFYYH